MAWKFSGERIVMAREARDMTQAQAAKMIGISQQQLSQYENEDVKPGAENICNISNALVTPPKFFFVQTDDNNHQERETK